MAAVSRHPGRIVPTDATEEGVTIGEVRIARGEWATLRLVVYPTWGGMREQTVTARYDGLRDGQPFWWSYLPGPWFHFDLIGVSVRRQVVAVP